MLQKRRRRLQDNNEETICYGDDECCDSNICVEPTPLLVTISPPGCYYSGVKRTGAAADLSDDLSEMTSTDHDGAGGLLQ